jgi:hypothetical protein
MNKYEFKKTIKECITEVLQLENAKGTKIRVNQNIKRSAYYSDFNKRMVDIPVGETGTVRDAVLIAARSAGTMFQGSRIRNNNDTEKFNNNVGYIIKLDSLKTAVMLRRTEFDIIN